MAIGNVLGGFQLTMEFTSSEGYAIEAIKLNAYSLVLTLEHEHIRMGEKKR